MINLITLEIRKIFKPVILTLIITTLMFLAIIINTANVYEVQHNFEFWNSSIDYIAIIFPILAVCPTCWVMYYERKNKFLLYTINRISKTKYIFSKWIVCVISAFLIIFIPMFIGGIISLSFLNNVTPPQSYELAFYQNLFMPDLIVNNVYMYVLLHCLWDGFLSMIVASIGFILSLYIDNLFVILTGPFIYVILDNFIMATLGFTPQRFIASFYINSITNTNILNLLTGPTIAIMFSVILLIFFKFKKEKIYNL